MVQEYLFAGKSFVSELANRFNADRSLLESIAFKAPMPLPTIILQKPSKQRIILIV